MLTVFRDTETHDFIYQTYKYEQIPNAIDKKFKYRKRIYMTLKHVVENCNGCIVQTIYLLELPNRKKYIK